MLGLLVADPWAEERALARALYAGAVSLAWEADIGEVCARSNLYGNYPCKVGYTWGRGEWRVDAALAFEDWGALPADGWPGILALLGIVATPFFRAFRP
ncbi:MAG: hypothetical protein M3283_11765 [Actinomycetota bacterium]|nr:hypothetical protein [Actinomycetota bacterium]